MAELWLNLLGDEKATPFCGRQNSTKIERLGGGGVSHSQNAFSGPNLISAPGQNIQTYHNQPLGGWALAELAGGWEGGFIL